MQVPAAEEGSGSESIEGNRKRPLDKSQTRQQEKSKIRMDIISTDSEKSTNPGDMKRMHDTYKLFNSDGTDGKVRGMETQDAKSEPESSTLRFMSIEDSVQWHTAITSGKQQDARKKGVPLPVEGRTKTEGAFLSEQEEKEPAPRLAGAAAAAAAAYEPNEAKGIAWLRSREDVVRSKLSKELGFDIRRYHDDESPAQRKREMSAPPPSDSLRRAFANFELANEYYAAPGGQAPRSSTSTVAVP